jgi:hypothetical protein
MSDYGVKIGIKADTGIMLLKPSTVSAMVNVVGSYHNTSSVTHMMSDLNWTPLEVWCIRYRLIFFYKVIHHLVAIPYSNLLIPVDTRT